MDWKNRKVLVTGAGGFIGSHLTERLINLGAHTTAFVEYNSLGSWGWLDDSPFRSDAEVVLGDVRDIESVSAAVKNTDCVFHLAALIAIPYSYQAPRSYVDTNINGTLNVLIAGRDAGVEKIVHTSTSEVYGSARTVPIDESHPLQGQSPYAASKIGADKMAEAYYLSFNTPITTVRPFNTYGPRQSMRAVLPTIIAQALHGEDIRLGRLDPTRDFNFVSDTVDGFIAAAESSASIGETINIGSGREISIGDVTQRILDEVGVDLPILCEDERTRPDASEVMRLCADNTKARDLIDWTPSTSLEEGLKSTIEWTHEHFDHQRVQQFQV